MNRFKRVFLPVLAVVGVSCAATMQTTAAQSGATENDSRPIVINLSNGKEIPLSLRKMPNRPPGVSRNDSLAKMYEPLVAAAKSGDMSAARFLGKALRACKSAFTSEAELEAAIGKLYSTGLRTYGGDREPVQMQGVANSDVELAMRQNFRFCDGVSKSDAQMAVNWTKMAADSGDYLALKHWIGIIGLNDESFRLWHGAFSRGHVLAAQELVYYYQNGISEDMAGNPDHFHAYVYQTIAFKIMSESVGDTAAPDNPNASLADSFDAVLAEMASKLDPLSLQIANDEVAAILTANENCCIL